MDRSRLNDSIGAGLKTADGLVELVRYGGQADHQSIIFSSDSHVRYADCRFRSWSLGEFSFNSPFGVCPDCHGLGTRREVNAELVLGDPSISILEGVIATSRWSGYLRKIVLPTLAKAFNFQLNALGRA